MDLVKVFVVFLLGLGAAFGAYASGMVHYVAHSGLQGWFMHARPVVLQVSADSAPTADSTCATHYSVDNHSSQRVLVLFTPPNDQFAARSPNGFNRSRLDPPGYYGLSGYYGSSEIDTTPVAAPSVDTATGAPRVHAQATIPVEVAPGEEKDIEPLDGGQNSALGRNGARIHVTFAAARCESDRLVTFLLNDCTTNESGVCSAAGTFSPGGEYNSY